MSPDYDIIVAGAGIAGCLAAMSAAKEGAKVLLLDRNNESEPGKKTNWGWVCGDAVAKSHITYVHKEVGLNLSSSELEHEVTGVYALSPDLKNKFMFEGAGYMLNRPALARKLVKSAVAARAEYRPNHEVEGPIIEDGAVAGVFGRDERKKEYRIRSKLVIDCLGMSSTIRRKLPPNEFIEKDIKTEDIESTGRYIMNFELVNEDLNYYDPRNAIIHLNQELAPGGYGWVFPRKGSKVNIGVGIEKKSLDVRNAKLGKKDTLHSLIDGYVAWNRAIRSTGLDDADGNGKGYWQVSVRRQFGSLVYKNYLGAGDSVAMPNPISAGGIGPAMVAGAIAGKVAAGAIGDGDTSMGRLWDYNLKFNEAYGSKAAALEAFRVYLQSLNNDLINYGMSHFVTKEEAEQLAYGVIPEMKIASAFHKILSGISNVNAFKNLLFTVNKMKRLMDLYSRYPKDMSGFKAWNEAVAREIQEVKEKLPPNPI